MRKPFSGRVRGRSDKMDSASPWEESLVKLGLAFGNPILLALCCCLPAPGLWLLYGPRCLAQTQWQRPERKDKCQMMESTCGWKSGGARGRHHDPTRSPIMPRDTPWWWRTPCVSPTHTLRRWVLARRLVMEKSSTQAAQMEKLH